MADRQSPRRKFSDFLTGAATPEPQPEPAPPPRATEAPLYPPAGTRRPVTRIARPVSASPPPAPGPATLVGPEGIEGAPMALPDHAAPPGAVLVAGVDANGVEYVLEDDPDVAPLVDPRYDLEDRNWVRYRTSWGGFLRIVGLVIFVLWAFTTVRGRIYDWVDAQVVPGGLVGEEIDFTIPSGASTNNVATALANDSIINNATVFRYWLRCEGELTITGFLGCENDTTFQAGDYVLRKNMSYDDVVAVLAEGPIPEVYFSIGIPEGLRVNELVDRLMAVNDKFDRRQLQDALTDPSLVSEYFQSNSSSELVRLEGTLFPATYDVAEDDIADEDKFLQRMADEFDARYAGLLDELGRDSVVDELGLTDYQIITVASLIEEEARVAVDRPLMARAIYNRLLQGTKLQIDATVYYAAGKSFTDTLFQSDLDAESPYNTYVSAGVPPGPIAAPSEASLRAALAPAEGDYIFWARTDEGGVPGAHTFSTTLAEHNAAVAICTELGYCG